MWNFIESRIRIELFQRWTRRQVRSNFIIFKAICALENQQTLALLPHLNVSSLDDILENFNLISDVVQLIGDFKSFQRSLFLVAFGKDRVELMDWVHQSQGLSLVIGDVVLCVWEDLFPLQGFRFCLDVGALKTINRPIDQIKIGGFYIFLWKFTK